ncbi:MAG: UDP-N-acetylmuramoyl-tripeptide--D-alanyl-D-alanine ligase [Anaerolineales bacterium]|nr:UDP-N-acetylmuramoyl-tripeptide--D-alanyl-D-alanine ligase [Anaerolineales bacterium]
MLTLGHVVEALTGYQSAGGPQVITDVVIDSRLTIPGAMFVALPGERTDGHAFVASAFDKGAQAALVQRDLGEMPDVAALRCQVLDLREPVTYAQLTALQLPVCLRVGDTLKAMQALAVYWRRRVPARVIGVTGSVGKTTTKELIAAVLSTRYRTFKTEGNYNNEIGLPLMLLKLSEAHERAVLEMGFYQPGEIKFLCDLARPQVGVVNNVYAVHLERAGSIENIARGKGELVEALPPAPEGVAVLNYDDPLVLPMRSRTRARVFTYGLDPAADLWAGQIESLGLGGIRFQLHYRNEALQVRAPLLGRHSVHTCLRAAAVGLIEGLTWQEIVDGLQAVGATQLRLVAVTGPEGSLILDDTYNASPESVIAALNLLNDLDGRHVAVLGDMLELGAYEEVGHRLVGRRARDVADLLITVGPLARMIAAEARDAGLAAEAVVELADSEQALLFLRRTIRRGDVVLLKGSRAVKLDRIVPALEVRP